MEGEKTQVTLFTLSWPIFMEITMNRLMGIIDTFMLSYYSDYAVAAVGFSNQLIMMVVMLCGVVTIGTTILVSRYIGAKEYDQVSDVISVSISLNFLFGLCLSIILFICASDIVQFLGLPTELHKEAVDYLIIIGSATVIQSLLMILSAIMKGYGYTKQVMYVITAINILNLVGNYLFIFGPWGIPILGVKGVAIATVVSKFIGMMILIAVLIKKAGKIITLNGLFAFPRQHVKNLLKIGIPSSLDSASWNMQMVIITMYIAMVGSIALTANVYTTNLRVFITAFAGAIGQGTLILIARKLGEKRWNEAYQKSMTIFRKAILIAFLVAFIFFLISKPLMSIFTENMNIISLGATLLLLTVLLEPGRAFNLVFNNSLKAAGDVNYPMTVNIIGMWCISVPFAYLLGIYFGLGLVGIWIAFIVDEWVRGIALMMRWRSRKWIKKLT